MTGTLTTKRHKHATMRVDQFSRMGFVWLQKSASAPETLEGKAAFEAFSKDRGASVQAHHADNGIFKANAWVQNCHEKGQTLTFAGANAHHQNGMAE